MTSLGCIHSLTARSHATRLILPPTIFIGISLPQIIPLFIKVNRPFLPVGRLLGSTYSLS